MGVFEKLQNYSASNKSMTSDVFDVSTPEGCFFAKLHSQGYLMYEYVYENSQGESLTEKKFQWLSDEEKSGYMKKLKYTELHDMLVASGDQLVLANAGSGKALSNNTRVLTNKGYKPIGNLSVNDKVFGTDLQLHSVRGVFPQGKKRVNVMTIACSDSTYPVNCCDEHLWAIKSDSNVEVISTKDVKRRLEDERSLPLVDLGSIESDMNGNLVLSDIECACILFTYFHLTDINDPDEFIDEYIDGTTLKFNFERGMFDREYTKNLVNLLRTPDLKVKYIGDNQDTCWESYYFEYSPRFFDILKSKSILSDKNIKKSIDRLIPLLSVQDMDVLRIFGSGRCTYEITNVEETDSEVDMTCIEVDSDNHLFLIEHLIPTHNTTALIFKIMHDIITGEATKVTSIPNGNQVRVVDDIFVGTFLKTGADELADRLASWQRGLGYTVTADRVNFSTLHAEFKRALNAMGASTPIGKPAEVTKCLKKAIDNLGISRDGNALTSEDYNIIGGIVTYCRGRLDDKRYSHPSSYDYGLTPVILDRLVSDFANQRQLAGIMDFEDLQELLYKFLYVTPNKAVQDFCANRYKYIYLDEFQDTSQIQYAIIKFYARGRLWMNRGTSTEEDEQSPLYSGNETLGKIVVVGDNDQCIYEWRGSDNIIIEEYFDHDFRPCLTSLSYNYRCPSNILDAIVPSIKVNKGHERREYHAARDGGVSRGYYFTNYKAMLNKLVEDIDEDMREGNTVAVLCRTNFDGTIPAFILEASKQYDFSISGQNMTFDSPLPKKILAVTSLFTERSSTNVKNTLSLFVPRFATWGVKQLVDVLKNNGKSVWQIPEADIEYSCPELAPIIKDIKSRFYENNKRVREKEMSALKYVYELLRVEAFGGSSLYCESARAYIDTLLFLIDNNKFEGVFEFVEYVESLNEKLHARINNTKAKINIATVHEFKGKERDSVIVWNDSEGVFPSSKTDVNNEIEMEGERRVHYVACTRARKKNTIYCMYGRESIFVKEMDLNLELSQPMRGTLKNSLFEKELSDEEKNLLNILAEGE